MNYLENKKTLKKIKKFNILEILFYLLIFLFLLELPRYVIFDPKNTLL